MIPVVPPSLSYALQHNSTHAVISGYKKPGR